MAFTGATPPVLVAVETRLQHIQGGGRGQGAGRGRGERLLPKRKGQSTGPNNKHTMKPAARPFQGTSK